jgi:hypothetical protein
MAKWIMPNILELEDNLIYVEDEKWSCHFGYGEPIKLGLILEAVDLLGGDEYPVVVEAHIIPQPEHLCKGIAKQAVDEGACSRVDLIRYLHRSCGGVPTNLDAIQAARASFGPSKIIRHFRDIEEAMKFAKEFYAINASGLFGLVDIVLDNPLREGTGWDMIREMSGP